MTWSRAMAVSCFLLALVTGVLDSAQGLAGRQDIDRGPTITLLLVSIAASLLDRGGR